MPAKRDVPAGLCLFISHRHDDQPLAEVLQKAILSWVRKTPVRVFLSSDFYTEDTVDESAKKNALEAADVVLLVYTVADTEWMDCVLDGCMATNSTDVPTRIIVLQCFDGPLLRNDGRCILDIREENAESLAKVFHRDANFFPRLGGAYAKRVREATLKQFGESLYSDLHAAQQQQAVDPGSSDQAPSIFISHRHKDKNLADAIRKTMESWGAHHPPKIFQSSDAIHGVTPGQALTDELKRAISDAELLLLVYTGADEDWSFCMWECGMADHPNTMKTRIVVFQCLEDVPAPFDDRMRVMIEEESIKNFANSFHYGEDFFPRLGRAYVPETKDETIELRAGQLFGLLREEVPEQPPKTKNCWHFLNLSLPLTHEDLDSIKSAESDSDAFESGKELIRNACTVTKTSKEALSHFGIDEHEPRLKLIDLYDRWRSVSEYDLDWFTDVCKAMTRVIRNRPSIEVQVPIRSVRTGFDVWYLPVVNRAESSANDKHWEFHLELYRIPAEGELIRINSSPAEPASKPATSNTDIA